MKTIQTIDACCSPIGAQVIEEEAAQELARAFKVLAEPVRVRILSMLAKAPQQTLCVCDLPAALGIGQPTVSHHMKLLHDAGFVTRERRGKWAHFTLIPSSLDVLRDALSGTSA